MRYLLLICPDPTAQTGLDPAAQQAVMHEYDRFTEAIAASGELLGGEALQGTDTATTVRVRDGRVAVTDGPFAETTEVLGGYYLVDVKDLDRALELAAQIPGARTGSVEVRPIWERGG